MKYIKITFLLFYITHLCYNQKIIPLSELGTLFDEEKIEPSLNQESNEVRLAHLALQISHFSGGIIPSKISILKYSKNSFVRFTYAQLLYYFGDYHAAKERLILSLMSEIQMLQVAKPYSRNYVYAPWSLVLLKKIDSEQAFQFYEKLKNAYENAIEFYGKIGRLTMEETNFIQNINAAYFKLSSTYQITPCAYLRK